jgi:hypothetical protein
MVLGTWLSRCQDGQAHRHWYGGEEVASRALTDCSVYIEMGINAFSHSFVYCSKLPCGPPADPRRGSVYLVMHKRTTSPSILTIEG